MHPRPRALVVAAAAVALAGLALRLAPAHTPAPSPPLRAQPAWNVHESTPLADTYVRVSEMPTPVALPSRAPAGAEPELLTGFSDGAALRDTALVRFALPTPEPDTVLVYADLTMHMSSASVSTIRPPRATSGTMQLRAAPITGAWDEATLASPDLPALGEESVHADARWGPCVEGGCGEAVVDVRPILFTPGATGLALRTSPTSSDAPVFAWQLGFGSRESAQPPRLRLAYQQHMPMIGLDLTGSAAYRCDTGKVDVTLRYEGAFELSVDVRVEAVEEPPRRLTVPGPIANQGSRTVTDEDWRWETRHYVIDPDGYLPESNRDNNVVQIAIPECAMLGKAYLPWGGR